MSNQYETKSLDEVWKKVCIITATYSAFLLFNEILEESDSIEDAKNSLNEFIKKLQKNNIHEYKTWIRRWLNF